MGHDVTALRMAADDTVLGTWSCSWPAGLDVWAAAPPRPYTPVEGGLGSGELYFDIAIVTTQLQN